ncbi:hypothetical protein GCM10018980_51880 [Streptomyces capoamus]|uniref:Uncharacterized protein n=1 Tax=Streptomyces capoamus TaxID=68183 RepID=A0A919KDH4_9ACTN|nr:hypothetical protein [Streptomyces capoamus]GGW15748.1 hypothetical protein GCM10010501_28930 [Streptomyces libani subsp. rufus]GHG62167.1 hypothetical protein GCM10018980_51880 [Streptomyces capoamus]
MPKIRTTMRPDLELDVDDAEYLDLQRQGLLLEEDTAEEVPPATAAPAAPEPAPQPAAVAPKKTGPAAGPTKES